MDNFTSDFINNINIPLALLLLLREDNEARDYYSNMDDPSRTELNNYAEKFQSKEELERYLYYLTDDNFK